MTFPGADTWRDSIFGRSLEKPNPKLGINFCCVCREGGRRWMAENLLTEQTIDREWGSPCPYYYCVRTGNTIFSPSITLTLKISLVVVPSKKQNSPHHPVDSFDVFPTCFPNQWKTWALDAQKAWEKGRKEYTLNSSSNLFLPGSYLTSFKSENTIINFYNNQN